MFEIILLPNFVAWIAVALLGLIFGSFLNVVLHRLPLMLERQWYDGARALLRMSPKKHDSPELSLFHPPSHCVECSQPILWRHKIPIVSFIVLKGRCAYCQQRISRRYPTVELLTMLLWLLIFAVYGVSYVSVAGWLLATCLIALAAIDQERSYLADEITMPLLWAGLILNYFALLAPLEEAVLGAVCGYLSFYLINYLYKFVRGRHGLGHGDMKLLAVLGAWLGWQPLPMIVLIATLSGVVVYCIARLKHQYQLSDSIPFGPYLAAGGIVAFLFLSDLQFPMKFLPRYGPW